jgi:hypothetical protein
MRVQLTKKLAEMLDGIDLSRYAVGDIVEVTRAEAELLIAEGWAIPVAERPRLVPKGARATHALPGFAEQQPHVPLRSVERLREIRRAMEQRSSDRHERRRAEDRLREELHDARARTFGKRRA